MLKKILYFLYSVTVVCMSVATLIEKTSGTETVQQDIYGSWWFCMLWGMLALVGIIYYLQHSFLFRHPNILLLHTSFLLILLGALLTHLTSYRGMMHLRTNEPTNVYFEKGHHGIQKRELPFQIKLSAFNIKYHDGTNAAMDYDSHLIISDGSEKITAIVSMNHILNYRNIRFYQSSFDPDRGGSILSLNSDPYGIPVTYTGYGLLFLSLIIMLFDPRGNYRKVLRNPILKNGFLILCFFLCTSPTHATTVSKNVANEFGRLYILYNGRICPLETFAIDFTRKLYGKTHYHQYTPEQVVAGFIFFGKEWSAEPILKIKDGDMKSTLQLPDFASINTFFNQEMGGYTIGPYLEEYQQGQQDKFHQQIADVDDKIHLIMELRQGILLKLFPHIQEGKITWFAPTDALPSAMDKGERLYIQQVFTFLYQDVLAGNDDAAIQLMKKIQKYQIKNGGNSIPATYKIKAEYLYNTIPFAKLLFMVNLTMGFICLFITIRQLTYKETNRKNYPQLLFPTPIPRVILGLSWLTLSLCIVLRWIISGTIPMGNGYETLLNIAWIILFAAIILNRKYPILFTFAFILSGFFLLVAHIGQMDPQITHRMPVLNSPLLSIHVSIIMIAYALLSLTFLCSITALFLKTINPKVIADKQIAAMKALSEIFLYPSITCLGSGIFIGAIWANISWGQYWSWDPKETWALITLMIYIVPVHTNIVPSLRKPLIFHTKMFLL
jgi:ABC-type transport system involved in cytochrome c biogenesis permease subunit